MRGLVAALLLIAACYQAPSYPDCELQCTVGGGCPAGSTCVKGRCRTSEDIVCASDVDPPPGCAIPTAWGVERDLLLQANADRGAYTTAMSGELAALDVLRKEHEHDVKIGKDSLTLTTLVIADLEPMRHRTPRLSPEGHEMFVQHYVKGEGTSRFFRYVWQDETFVLADEMVVFTDVEQTLGESDRPGTPTAVSKVYPRRMMIPKGAELWELEQSTADPTRWDFVHATTPAELGLATIRDPQLSWDGLRLVFTGSATGGDPFFVYGATRRSFWEPFRSPAQILMGTTLEVEIAFPFLSADCKTLYGRNVGSGKVGLRSAL